MKKWFDIFKGGIQKCSRGRLHDGNALIDRAVARFQAGSAKPPVIVGHRKDNPLKYAEITGLRRVDQAGTGVLQAEIDAADPVFFDLVKSGQLPNRSAAFASDGSLDHLALLGVSPPAVADLGPMEFSSAEDLTEFELVESDEVWWRFRSIGDAMSRLRDYLIETLGLEKADQILPDYQVDNIKAPKPAPEAAEEFSQAGDPAGAPTQRETEEAMDKEQLEAALATAKKEAEQARADFAAAQTEARKQQAEAWFNGLVSQGKALPAWKDMGLVAFAANLDNTETIEFAKAEGETAKTTPAAFFKAFVESIGQHALFTEMKPPASDAEPAEFMRDGAGGKPLTMCV